MKEISQNLIGQKERDDAMMNFVSRQAQEAILDPNLPEYYKDEVVGAAVGTLLKIAERKKSYNVRQRESSPPKPHIIYEAEEKVDGTKRKTDIPPIIREINENLKEGLPENEKDPTFEGIAQKLGIGKRTLYGWARSNSGFSESLERLITIQKEDPLKTGISDDRQVNSATLSLLLLETQIQIYKDNLNG